VSRAALRRAALVPAALLVLGAAAGPAQAGPDVTALIAKATAQVRGTKGCSRAILLEAEGTSPRRVTTASGITRWRFVYDNQSTPHFRFRSAYVTYTGGRWGKVVRKAAPFLEDLRIRTVPRMTLARAVARLRAAGYRSGFFNVTLRRPLTRKGTKYPLYIFGFGGRAKVQYASVNTHTGAVHRIKLGRG
jgi:hypothetical protein